MTDQTKQPTKTNGNGQELALQGYGNRDEVKEMEARILAMLPGSDKLSVNERRGLAQLSVAHGLNPFNGECWAIPGRGLMIGIKGLRKKGHEQIEKIGGNFWVNYREITDPEERKRWRIDPGSLAFEAMLYDTANIRTYVDTIKELTAAKIPWEAVERMVGSRPYTSGIGILKPGENTKMEPVQCARKRAESNAIKQRFDVPFGVAVADEESGEIIEGEAVEVGGAEPPAAISHADADAEIAREEELQSKRASLFETN